MTQDLKEAGNEPPCAWAWDDMFQAAQMVSAKALWHIRETVILLLRNSFLAHRSVSFASVSHTLNTMVHLGEHGKDAQGNQLLRASGNWSSFLGSLLSRATTGRDS